MKVFKSIRNNFFANGISILINVIFQLVSIPIFIEYWGTSIYADWIILSSISTYLSMSDIGISNVSINEFTICFARGNFKSCNSIITNNLFFVSIVFITVLLVIICIVYFFNLTNILMLSVITEVQSEIILILLVFQVFSSLYSSALDGIYRATNKNALSVMINNAIKIIESVILLLGIILEIEITLVIFFTVLPKILGFIFKLVTCRKLFPHKLKMESLSKTELIRLIKPSLSFLSIPLGNSIIIQGFTLLINFLLGGQALVIFNTTRTLMNFIKTGLGLISYSISPQISLLYGSNDINKIRKLNIYSVGLSFYFALFSSLFLIVFGDEIYKFWTNDLKFDTLLFITFTLSLLSYSLWFPNSVVLTSTNNHTIFSKYFLLSSILSLVFGFLIILYTNEISLVPLSFFLSDFFLILVATRQTLFLLNQSHTDLLLSIYKLPFEVLKRI